MRRSSPRDLLMRIFWGRTFPLAWCVVALVAAIGAYAVLAFFHGLTCSARWSGTYETEYGVLSGCRVNVEGRWMPEERVRAIE